MPKAASSNPDAKLTDLNGHFGYYQKCNISTNALGIVRNVNFYDTDNNLDLDLTSQDIKDQYDSKSLIPSLETFFQLHPNFLYKYFLGDSGFDADDNYDYLHNVVRLKTVLFITTIKLIHLCLVIVLNGKSFIGLEQSVKNLFLNLKIL